MQNEAIVEKDANYWLEHELLVIKEIAKLLGKSLDSGYVIKEMLHLLSELLGLNQGHIFQQAHDGSWKIMYSYGLTVNERDPAQHSINPELIKKVLRYKQPVTVHDINADPIYSKENKRQHDSAAETASLLALPIEINESIQAMLVVYRMNKRSRSINDDLQILKVVSTIMAQTIKINALVKEQTVRLESENRNLKFALEHNTASHGIVGNSPALQKALQQIAQVAETDVTVLLLGESGTGKELFARALHLSSPRRDMPFIKINCGAIPENLFESELFGHEKGAFTGAVATSRGRFEQADGGTLFLDEIGDLPLMMQVKFLRVLQDKIVQRVGGKDEIPVNVRIVAATHCELQELVEQGKFRADLFYRINVIPIRLPPLRERRDDFPLLLFHILNHLNQSHQRNVNISQSAVKRLWDYHWPGNIRQLHNTLERLVLLCMNSTITDTDVKLVLASEMDSTSSNTPRNHSLMVRSYMPLESCDRTNIEAALHKTSGNKSRAAQLLGLTLRQFNYRRKILGIE
jgi:Nif-specific regulatory protein